jgi:hypothetical protein
LGDLDFGSIGAGAAQGGAAGGPWGAALGAGMSLLGGSKKSGAASGAGAKQDARSQSGNIDNVAWSSAFNVTGSGSRLVSTSGGAGAGPGAIAAPPAQDLTQVLVLGLLGIGALIVAAKVL